MESIPILLAIFAVIVSAWRRDLRARDFNEEHLLRSALGPEQQETLESIVLVPRLGEYLLPRSILRKSLDENARRVKGQGFHWARLYRKNFEPLSPGELMVLERVLCHDRSRIDALTASHRMLVKANLRELGAAIAVLVCAFLFTVA